MTVDRSIFIRNIYYMLSYAFQELGQKKYEDIKTESFEHVHDLFADILAHGVSYQLKQGLNKQYILRREVLTTLRGKLDVESTLKERIAQRRKLGCEYDELSVNNILNQILKSSMLLAKRHPDVKKSRKVKLSKLLSFFDDVNEIDLRRVIWKNLRFDRNSRTYQTLCFICYFLTHELLLTTDNGSNHMPQFYDEHMCRLYEKFLLEYFRRHHSNLKPTAKQINWNIREEESSSSFLPIMKSDIYLTNDKKTLIIDAKYYEKSMQSFFNKPTIHSNNLYQIHTYVYSEDCYHTGNVDGMLLYAKTSEEITPDGKLVTRDGNTISFKSLDLNVDFDKICKQLDKIVDSTFSLSEIKTTPNRQGV